jgi:thermostable 8-oxoguanine DNA glycosylase
MFDFKNPTNFNRTQTQKEEFILFAQLVSGKQSWVVARMLDHFLSLAEGSTPFAKVRNMIQYRTLHRNIVKARLGQYKRRNKFFRQVVKLDACNLTLDNLSQLHGIGLKTARFILLHNDQTFTEAAVDTHVLKFLKSKGYNVPKSTPTNPKRYRELATAFEEQAKLAHMPLADFDAKIWNEHQVAA